MQNLWSRVAQVRASCRCPQCLNAGRGVSWRGTTTTNAIRPQYWTSSTLWYSGIFAAAATFDAGAKMRRREQWDQAIADVKQELGQAVQVDGQRAVRGEEEREDLLEEGKGKEMVMERDVGYEMGQKGGWGGEDTDNLTHVGDNVDGEAHDTIDSAEGDAELVKDLERNLDSTSRRTYHPFWPVNTGPDPNRHHLPPQSIYATTYSKHKAEASRWTEKKLKLVEFSVERFLLKFFWWLHANDDVLGYVEEAAQAVPASFADKIRQSKEDIHSAYMRMSKELDCLERTPATNPGEPFNFHRDESIPSTCNYQQDDLGQFRDTQHDLNTSIQRLFNRGDAGELTAPQYLAKVFYNLSVSTAPPNVDTYNALVIGLSRGRHEYLTRQFIRTFRRAHIRPNEVSLAAVLNFYTDIGDAHYFHRWVKLMRGGEDGLMESRPGNWRFKASGGRVVLREGRPERQLQLPYPTPMVMTALLRGVLKFSGFDSALEVSKSMGPEGWGIDMRCLGVLLRDCTKRNDWIAGHAIWRETLALAAKGSVWDAPRFRWQKVRISCDRFADMLYLCTKSGQKGKFEEVMKLASESWSTEKVRRLVPAVKRRQEAAETQEKESAGNWGGTAATGVLPREDIEELRFRVRTSASEIAHQRAEDPDEFVGRPMVLEPQPQQIAFSRPTGDPQEPFDGHMMADGSGFELAADEAEEPSKLGYFDRALPRAKLAGVEGLEAENILGPTEEQLHGHTSGSRELDDYELLERPMKNS